MLQSVGPSLIRTHLLYLSPSYFQSRDDAVLGLSEVQEQQRRDIGLLLARVACLRKSIVPRESPVWTRVELRLTWQTTGRSPDMRRQRTDSQRPRRSRAGRCLVRKRQDPPGALPRGLRAGGATDRDCHSPRVEQLWASGRFRLVCRPWEGRGLGLITGISSILWLRPVLFPGRCVQQRG